MPRTPESDERRELVIVMFARGEMFSDISEAARITVRGCQKIVADARAAGDPRAKLRRQTEGQRQNAKVRVVQRAHQSGRMPAATRIHAITNGAIAGLDPDFDEGRW